MEAMVSLMCLVHCLEVYLKLFWTNIWFMYVSGGIMEVLWGLWCPFCAFCAFCAFCIVLTFIWNCFGLIVGLCMYLEALWSHCGGYGVSSVPSVLFIGVFGIIWD